MARLIAQRTDLPVELAAGLLLSSILAIAPYRLKLLDLGGCAVLTAMGVIIFGIGGWPLTAPIGCFFLLSTVFVRLLAPCSCL